MEVQQIRSLISRQQRLLFVPIDNWLAWQQHGHGPSARRPRADGDFVLMLQPAIFSASHSYCWMQPDGPATEGGRPYLAKVAVCPARSAKSAGEKRL